MSFANLSGMQTNYQRSQSFFNEQTYHNRAIKQQIPVDQLLEVNETSDKARQPKC
jgi:hypothetical protein